MKLKISYAITLLLFILPIALSLENNGFRIELSHVDSKGNFTKSELIYRAAARTMHRLSRFKGMQLFSSANITSTVHGYSKESPSAEYFMDLAIGTPPLHFSAVVDTGSDLIWTQCSPCQKYVSQPTPIYDPSISTTVSSIPCNSTLYQDLCFDKINPTPSCLCSYYYLYMKGWTSGTLKKETFTFGNTKSVQVQLSNIVFGCSTSTSNDYNATSGLVGFGRGSFSLPSQLHAGMFSYCLTSFLHTNSTSTLFLGPLANHNQFSGIAHNSTPFVKNRTSKYYLSLQGISLGTTKLLIQPSTFLLQSDGTGAIFIDSGTSLTYLKDQAHRAVQNAIISIVNLRRFDASSIGLDTCFYLPSGTSLPTMPDMTFHFEGADMVLPVDNYMIPFEYQKDSLLCLAILGSDSFSILGNYQQQNFHILYDLDNEVLSFAPAQCDNL